MATHPLAVGGVDDHVHLLIAVKPTHFFPEVMRDLKAHSSHWVRGTVGFHEFAWQEGYGVFSVGCHGDATIRRYIEAQEAHHRSRSFEAELRAMVAAHGEGPGEAV
jgi:REP element-mobilizing transposase RayT